MEGERIVYAPGMDCVEALGFAGKGATALAAGSFAPLVSDLLVASDALDTANPRASLVALLPRPVPTSSIVPLPDDLVRSAVAAIPAQSRPTRKRKVEAVSRAAAPPPTVAAKSAAPLPPVAAGSAAATPLSSPAASDVPTSISDEALAALAPEQRVQVRDEFKRVFGELVLQLYKKQYKWKFGNPFTTVLTPEVVKRLGIPDYFDIVKEPTDLHTIYLKLVGDRYTDAEQVFRDLRLVYHNAMLYNPQHDPVHEMARDTLTEAEQAIAQAKQLFGIKMKKLRRLWRRQQQQQQQQQPTPQ